MKGFPKGFRPRRSKIRVPVPPTGFFHKTPREYDRNDWKQDIKNQIDDAIRSLKFNDKKQNNG